jgi:hypothetical protein
LGAIQEVVRGVNIEHFIRSHGENFRVERGDELFVAEGIMYGGKKKVQAGNRHSSGRLAHSRLKQEVLYPRHRRSEVPTGTLRYCGLLPYGGGAREGVGAARVPAIAGVEALREMMEEIRGTLEGQDTLSRGRLAEFSELLYSTTGQIGAAHQMFHPRFIAMCFPSGRGLYTT